MMGFGASGLQLGLGLGVVSLKVRAWGCKLESAAPTFHMARSVIATCVVFRNAREQ